MILRRLCALWLVVRADSCSCTSALAQLRLELSLTLVLSLDLSMGQLCFLFHLRQVVLLSFSHGFLVESGDHLVVIASLRLLSRLLNEVLLDDSEELFVAFVEDLWRDGCHVRLIQQEPVRVLALEDGEVRIEEGPKRLELLLISDLLLAVVGRVDKVTENVLFYLVRFVIFRLVDNFDDFLVGAKA